ncbi:MAG: phosphate/phosphite/phosphonate ABC transporter substrate-binding protein [Acidimicrobiales bacterium]
MSRSRRPGSAIALAVALALVGGACGDDDTSGASAGTSPGETANASGGDDWPDKLVFGAVPSEQATALQQSYAPIIDLIEEDLGVSVEFFQATDYAGIIEAQIAGRVDIAQFGPFSYVIAKSNGAEIEPAGALIDEPGAEPGYQSYGITRADNAEIESLEDFAGMRVCFVDPGSTSGYLYPTAGLLDVGIDPETGISPTFAGGHDASVISVNNGDCDAGFAFDNMVDEELIASGDIEEGDIKVVWKSEVIAGSPVAIRSDLPADLLDALHELFVEKANSDYLVANGFCEEGDCGITDEGAWGYAPVDDGFYDGVRAVCEVTKADACEG